MRIPHILRVVLLLSLLASACALPGGRPVLSPASLAAPATATPWAAPARVATSQLARAGAAAQQVARPNILFIRTDDLDVASTAYMPRLKSLLVDQGVSFSNYFVSVSAGAPSHASTLRGQYAQNMKIFGNQPPDGGFEVFHSSGDENSTIAVWLQAAGYRTMLAGQYVNGYPADAGLTFVPPGWSEWYSPSGGDAYGQFNYTLNENGKLIAYGSRAEDYGTDVYSRKTSDFIRRTAKDGVPFFAYVSLYAPHSPATPAPRHSSLFPDVKAPRGANFNETDVRQKPSYVHDAPLLTEKDISEIDQLYRRRLQSLQAVDEMIGNLIDTLKKTGELDHTYIFFSSDNGFHQGNHRLATGKVSPYEEDVRVPFIVRGPGVPAGHKLDYLTGNIDDAPTWAELAGIQTPSFVDGRSLVPLLKANPPASADWRQSYLLQNGDPDRLLGPAKEPGDNGLSEPPDALTENSGQKGAAPPQAVTPYQAVHTQSYIFIRYATGERELSRFRSDPQELHNIAAFVPHDPIQELSARLHALSYCSTDKCRTAENRPAPVLAAPGTAIAAAEATPRPSPALDPAASMVDRDVMYCSPDGVDQKMDVYYPRVPKTILMPVIIYVHGGSWIGGDKTEAADMLALNELLSRGYLVASINYRLAPQYKFPAQIEDVKCAVRYLRANALAYYLNPDRIGALGASAGGHLVSLLGTSDAGAGFEGNGGYAGQSSRVEAVAEMFGRADLRTLFVAGRSEGRTVFGCQSKDDPILERYSPLTYISKDDPPFLILHGDKDDVVPTNQADFLYGRLTAAGVPATIVIVKNGGHGFAPVGGPISPTRRELATIIADFFDKNLQ